MKILICAIGYNSIKESKVDVFELDQAKALKDRGHDVRIAACDNRSLRRIRKFSSYQYYTDGISVYTTNYCCGRLKGTIGDWIIKNAASKAYDMACADGWKPDIIHAHFGEMGYSFADIAAKTRIPFVITEHSSSMMGQPSKETICHAQYSYNKANCVIAVSSALAKSIEKNTGINSYVVPNIVNTDIFSYKQRKENDTFTFISASSLIWGKGMDLVIKAFARIQDKNAKLIIMGDGDERATLEKMVIENDIANRVSFFGKYSRQEFNDFLSHSDCFVLASRGETFGVVYIEAMAAGVPVIATKCGGPEEYVNNKTGLIVDVDNEDDLCIAMNCMIEKKQLYDNRLISEYAKEKFGQRVIAIEIEKIYNSILQKTNLNSLLR